MSGSCRFRFSRNGWMHRPVLYGYVRSFLFLRHACDTIRYPYRKIHKESPLSKTLLFLLSMSRKKPSRPPVPPPVRASQAPSAPASPRSVLQISLLITAAYFLVALFGVLHHEMWRDEFQACSWPAIRTPSPNCSPTTSTRVIHC